MNTNQNPTQQQPQEQGEQTSFGMPARLFDGYDGDSGRQPPEDFMKKLLASAPPEFQARAEQFAKERKAAGDQTEQA